MPVDDEDAGLKAFARDATDKRKDLIYNDPEMRLRDAFAQIDSGMFWQDPQLRDALARIMQAQQGVPPGTGQPPQMPGMNLNQSPGSGNRPYPDMSPASDPAMQQQVPGQRPYPDMTPDVPPQGVPQLPQPMQGIPNNPDGLPGLGPQSNSAFKLPGKMARLNPLDEVDPRDLVGRGRAGTA